jgi:class 3 adenylate cyclase
MVVGGVDNNPMHAHQIIALALDMQAAIERYNQDPKHQALAIRIGVHVGEAVAGVIGIKKFIYDVWGDTVNVASRMESTGIPGRIQVTEETVRALGDAYQFEARGPIEVKGKGLMTTFLVAKS